MRCPYCGSQEDKVIDSRTIKDGAEVRRRRQCVSCGARFTSYEKVEDIELRVIKKDGRREGFDRNKIRIGIQKACEKRPIASEQIDLVVERIEESFSQDRKEIPTREIGEAVIRELSGLDEVAYVRFASVYREFKDINEFMDELKGLLIDNNRKEVSTEDKTKKEPPKKPKVKSDNEEQ